jgi:hypothetical protein
MQDHGDDTGLLGEFSSKPLASDEVRPAGLSSVMKTTSPRFKPNDVKIQSNSADASVRMKAYATSVE